MAGFIHIIQQYCNHELKAREDEYQFCFRQNLSNPFVARVHNLVHPSIMVPEEFRRHEKYVEVVQPSSWITFQEAFRYANQALAGEVACIANLDIFLDHTSDWSAAVDLLRAGVVLSLSRTEIDGTGAIYKDPEFAKVHFANTQDAWLFRAPLDVPGCDFDIGTLGCDNALADRIRRAGRIPVNSPNQFRILHYDVARGKTPKNHGLIHAAARGDRANSRPEEIGQYLLPDIDQVRSLDALADSLRLSDLERYVVACDMMSRLIRVNNR